MMIEYLSRKSQWKSYPKKTILKLAISRMIALFAPLESYFLPELVTQAAIDICTFSLGNIFDVYWQLLMLLKASQPHCP